MTVSGVGHIHAIVRAFHGRFQVNGRGQPLVVLHRGFAGRERHFSLLTSETAFKACVTLLVQPPQVIPVTFKSSVCMVMPLSKGVNKNYTVIRLQVVVSSPTISVVPDA